MRPAAIGVGGVIALVATSARATSSFTYEAPAACPPRAHLAEAVAARTSEVIPDEVAVTIASSPDGFVGTLSLHGGTRRLALRRCDELVDALALSLALQLERSVSPPEPSAEDPPVAAPTPRPVHPPDPTSPSDVEAGAFARIEGVHLAAHARRRSPARHGAGVEQRRVDHLCGRRNHA